MIRTIVLVVLGVALPGAMGGQEPMFRDVTRMGPAEQEAVIREVLDQGLPAGTLSTNDVVMLILSNPELSIPLIERKIEEVLSASNTQRLFSVPGVNRDRFVGGAAGMIAWAGNRQALEAIAKLIRIDRKQFSPLVQLALLGARGNRYVLVYQGFGLGDPDLDPLIAAETTELLSGNDARYGERYNWAQVLVYRCKGIPTVGHWAVDPIATHLPAAVAAAIHDSVMVAATEIAAKLKDAVGDPPLSGVVQLTESEQTEFASSYINRGMPEDASANTFAHLVTYRSSMVIPMIERKIEDVLSSTSPSSLFSNARVDPRIFVARAGGMIAYVGNIEAIRAVASLMRIDNAQFAHLASETMGNARNMSQNPMLLAYDALGLDNPDLEPIIVSWASAALASPNDEWAAVRPLAQAMLGRYNAVPGYSQWKSDPLVSRLPAERADAVHDRVIALASEIWNERKAQSK
jgi:hypothetical protein